VNDTNDDGGIRAWAEQGAAEEALFDSLPPAEPERKAAPLMDMSRVTSALADFERISVCLAELRTKYPPDLVYDVTSKAGMVEAKAHRDAWQEPLRNTEKLRVAAKAPLLDAGRDIDARAKWLTAQLEAGLAPVAAQIKAETAPAALARRGGKAVAGLFINEQGGVRPERIAAAVGVIAAIVGLKLWGRSRRRCHCH
jgi:hypothetical protein